MNPPKINALYPQSVTSSIENVPTASYKAQPKSFIHTSVGWHKFMGLEALPVYLSPILHFKRKNHLTKSP